MEEIWKDIPKYEGLYQVSNLGNVKSFIRKTDRILKASAGSSGYYEVVLCKNGKHKTFRIHQLVAMAFLNHTPCGYKIIVDHIDNNPLNNKLENLQIITQRENSIKDKNLDKKLGVSFYNKKYYVRIYYNKTNCYLGRFDNENEAHLKYKEALKQIKLNIFTYKKRVKKSIYKGVSYNKQIKKWVSHYKGKHLGYFNSEVDASNKYLEIKNKNNALQKL